MPKIKRRGESKVLVIPTLVAIVVGIVAGFVGYWLFYTSSPASAPGPPVSISPVSPTLTDPCSGPHSIRDQIECAEKDLHPGLLAFEPRREMDQGQEETVSIRISPDKSAEFGKGFKNGPPVLKEIRVGPLMKAKLHGASDDFAISLIGEEKKIITAPYTEWTWEVVQP